MASLLDRLQRAFAPRPRATADDRAANLRLEEQKLRVELKRTELALVQRVAADADDPLEAWETVSLLTRRGKAGGLPARRRPWPARGVGGAATRSCPTWRAG